MSRLPDLLSIAEQFTFPGGVKNIQPWGSGIINDTFEVVFTKPASAFPVRLGKRAIMQRINRQVFSQPTQVMHNLAIILEHFQNRQIADGGTEREFLFPSLYRTRDGAAYFKDSSGEIWRAMTFIENTDSFDILTNMNQAFEAGYALGAFHQRLQGVAADKLFDTLPGFHITPDYLKQYDEVRQRRPAQRGLDKEHDFCLDTINANRELAATLVTATPALSTGIMHGDPKLNNILFDKQSGKAVSLIDLDTVKPGLVHYDIGDCLRSCCNRHGEMPDSGVKVEFDVSVCQAILDGYFTSARTVFELRDFDLLYDAIMLLPFELGLRFYTDYLSGNQYFKVKASSDNLIRAITQFRLLLSIQSQETALRAIIRKMKDKVVVR